MSDGSGDKDRGFSGLSSMVSNVEALGVDSEPTQTPKGDVGSSTPSDRRQEPFIQDQIRTKPKKSWSWIGDWIVPNASKIISLLIILAIIYWVDQDNSVPTSSPPPSSPGISNPATPPPPNTSPSMTFEKPATGTATFSAANIRWALKEEIKLEAMRNLVTTDAGIDAYNAMIDDYNSRAGEYRYYQADMDRAKRDVESMRSQIVTEAIAEARRINR